VPDVPEVPDVVGLTVPPALVSGGMLSVDPQPCSASRVETPMAIVVLVSIVRMEGPRSYSPRTFTANSGPLHK
jgi:hypothetical protein